MKTALVILLGALMALPAVADDHESHDGEGKWIQLFNGKDLTGWQVKIRGNKLGDNWGNTFRVEDGCLSVGYEAYDQFNEKFGHIFYHQPYGDYRLRVEYRFVGEQCNGGPGWAFRNSGIMIHGQSPESMEIDQDFPASIEVQLLGGNGQNPRTTANICTPYTHMVIKDKLIKTHCISSSSQTYHGDQWVVAELEVRGNHLVKNIVNGETVFELSQPQLDTDSEIGKKLAEAAGGAMLSGGSISLQSESHPVQFRKVELLPLEPSQK